MHYSPCAFHSLPHLALASESWGSSIAKFQGDNGDIVVQDGDRHLFVLAVFGYRHCRGSPSGDLGESVLDLGDAVPNEGGVVEKPCVHG